MAEKQWLTIDEAIAILAISRVTLYDWLHRFGIKPVRKPGQKHSYVSRKIVDRIQEIRAHPERLLEGK